MYAMLAAVAGGSMWLYVGLRRGRRLTGAAIALGLLNGLGLYTHLAYSLVMLAQAALVLPWLMNQQRAWRTLLAYVCSSLIAIILFLPWLPTAISQVFAQPNLAAAASPGAVLRVLMGWLSFGNAYELGMGGINAVVYFVLLLGLIGPKRRPMLLPVIWTLVSVLVYLHLELTTRYIRFLLPTQIAVALWMGRGLWVLWTQRIQSGPSIRRFIPKTAAAVISAAFLLTMANGLDVLYRHPDFQRDDIRGLARQIEESLRPGDAVLVSAAGVVEALGYYYDADAPLSGLPTSADDGQTRRQVLDIIDAHDRIYAVFYGAEEQDPNGVVESTLNRYAYEIDEVWVGDLRFVRYAVAVRLDAPRRLDLRFGNEIWLRSYALDSPTARAGETLPVQFIWSADARPAGRYKVFLQLLDADGRLAAQRDSEPAGGLSLTTTWQADTSMVDNHALLIPSDLPAGEYTLIVGLYDIDDPAVRLIANGASYAELARIRVEQDS